MGQYFRVLTGIGKNANCIEFCYWSHCYKFITTIIHYQNWNSIDLYRGIN